MIFYEFLNAVGQGGYRNYLEGIEKIEPLPDALHQELTNLLRRYYFVGGMPEAVLRHAADPGSANCRVVQIKGDLSL